MHGQRPTQTETGYIDVEVHIVPARSKQPVIHSAFLEDIQYWLSGQTATDVSGGTVYGRAPFGSQHCKVEPNDTVPYGTLALSVADCHELGIQPIAQRASMQFTTHRVATQLDRFTA